MSVGQTDEISRELERHIRTVPDFPTPGVSFKDITPLIEDGEALHAAVDALADATDAIDYDRILSAEARGFVFGTALAYRARKGLILARKPNKLPRETISATYELEYGTDSLEAHDDAIPPDARVAFLIELSYLNGRSRLEPYNVVSLVAYDDPDE